MIDRLRRQFASARRLAAAGILGLNERNLHLLTGPDRRQYFPLVDDKSRTRRLCMERGIAVPLLYHLIRRYGEIRTVVDHLAAWGRFVVKPAGGSGGRGILIVTTEGDGFATSEGAALSPADLRYHLAAILSGLYSLGGNPDVVLVEEYIAPAPAFHGLAVGGTPDIRILLYRGRPVMAMLRLPTTASRGRANLHQGAIGAGIDMKTGMTTYGVCRDRVTSRHPDTGAAVGGHSIPNWPIVLDTAVRVAGIIPLPYIGIDLVLGPDHRPVVLEVNARPGLAIQIANRTGLRPLLDGVDTPAPVPADLVAAFATYERA